MDILCTARLLRKAKKPVRLRGKRIKTVKKPETTKCTVKNSAKQRKVLKKKGKIYYSVRAYKKVTDKWQEKDHLQRVFSEKTEIVHCPSSNGADNGIYL